MLFGGPMFSPISLIVFNVIQLRNLLDEVPIRRSGDPFVLFRGDLLDFRLMKRESAVNSCMMESKKITVQVCINLNSGRGGKYKMCSHAEVGLCVLSPPKICGVLCSSLQPRSL